ncbi:DUF6174 domain-containing protein [Streptomyces sp. NPDC048514]|uniref:DUF6174 domain-containing protein n=1 Tax=Streptomyces sp. NPDC048514 TaxID=3365564 RepID=UPI00371B0430
MTAARAHTRLLSATALAGALLCVATACDDGRSRAAPTAGRNDLEGAGGHVTAAWQEPDAYVYTLTSDTQVLAGAFRVEVHKGKVTGVVGLDEDSRRQLREQHAEVPTIGELLQRLDRARKGDAETAQARYAADGHPVRISLDWDGNAIDDEALYIISAYEPVSGGRRFPHST